MSDIFQRLEPPRGGLERLQRAIDERRAPAWRPALALACASLLLIALVPVWQHWQARATLDARVASALANATAQKSAMAVENGAALLVADQPNVRIYWVAAVPAE